VPSLEPARIIVTDEPEFAAADDPPERTGHERPTEAAVRAARRDRGFTRVHVFYATDRKRAGDTPNEFYGSERASEGGGWPFEFGRCDVSIPYAHRPGEIERPSVWKFEFTENPARHVVLLDVEPIPMDQCLATLREEVNRSARQSAFVFVHGFNVPFANAARRTAQMKYDLGFDGAALMYSWPAPKNYVECEGNAVWTRPHLIEFLTRYVQESGATRIHLIAHSMGTRVLSNALKELAQMQGPDVGRYNEIILAAPDIDAGIFKTQIAPRIINTADRISIYSSSKDLALVASKKAHKYVRLGEGGRNLSVFPHLPKIDVVDASDVNESVLGHSYYGNSPTILRDVRQLLAGAAAAKRGLTRRESHYLFPRLR
jgi:esterase/lipase superfamily enzyme